eukprot:8932110-Pyramimonas_sp.AAC.3
MFITARSRRGVTSMSCMLEEEEELEVAESCRLMRVRWLRAVLAASVPFPPSTFSRAARLSLELFLR